MKHKCASHSKMWCVRCFWITAAFPIEHFIWVKIPFLRSLSRLAGL